MSLPANTVCCKFSSAGPTGVVALTVTRPCTPRTYDGDGASTLASQNKTTAKQPRDVWSAASRSVCASRSNVRSCPATKIHSRGVGHTTVGWSRPGDCATTLSPFGPAMLWLCQVAFSTCSRVSNEFSLTSDFSAASTEVL
eukprot:2453983-Prymnesium_polylepis.1